MSRSGSARLQRHCQWLRLTRAFSSSADARIRPDSEAVSFALPHGPPISRELRRRCELTRAEACTLRMLPRWSEIYGVTEQELRRAEERMEASRALATRSRHAMTGAVHALSSSCSTRRTRLSDRTRRGFDGSRGWMRWRTSRSASGFGLHWPSSTPIIMFRRSPRLFGTAALDGAGLGATVGRARSAGKSVAARLNGRKADGRKSLRRLGPALPCREWRSRHPPPMTHAPAAASSSTSFASRAATASSPCRARASSRCSTRSTTRPRSTPSSAARRAGSPTWPTPTAR